MGFAAAALEHVAFSCRSSRYTFKLFSAPREFILMRSAFTVFLYTLNILLLLPLHSRLLQLTLENLSFFKLTSLEIYLFTSK